MAALGLSSQGFCKIVCEMTFDIDSIIDQLDELRMEDNPGSFSFESSLFQAIISLDKLPTTFHR